MLNPDVRKDALNGTLACVLGGLTVVIGVYFLAFRPALLPEDLRHTGIEPGALPPAFLDWLGIVFSTLGGFITGFGITIVGIGVFLLSRRAIWIYLGTAVGGLVAFGRFLVSNIIIGYDSLWLIAAVFVLALALAIALLLKTVRRPRHKP